MKKLFTVTKFELLRYFISPLAYVYLIAFLMLNGSFAIYFGDFLNLNIAGLGAMFSFHPWIYLIFIPGISMRLWAEEYRTRTIVQITTMPIGISTLVLGKFLAAWLFCGLALALTFPFWITVNLLGEPDNAIILLSYVGSFILAGCMLSISQTMSALTKNQVIALVLSVIANLLFFLSGIEYVLSFFRLFAPISIIDMIASFSFLTHFSIITQGLLELRDIIFFLSIITLFTFTTIIIISFKTAGSSKFLKATSKSYYIIAFIFTIIGFIGLNLTANNFFRGFEHDFTQEKTFTLSSSSKNILQNLKEPITFKLYYSRILEERNPQIRIMFDDIRKLLRNFAKASNGKFSYSIHHPEPLDNIEDQAFAAGLQPIPVIDINQNAFFGAIIKDEIDTTVTIPYISLDRASYLEQDLIEKIFSLHNTKKTVGIITNLPIYDTQMTESYITPQWEIITQIKKFYNIVSVKKPQDIDNIDVLMLIHPQNLSPEIVERITTYTNNGGNSLVLLDVAAEAVSIFSPTNSGFSPSDISSLESLWGFRFYKDLVVADLDFSITIDASTDYDTNPMFVQDLLQFITPREAFNQNSIETKNLSKMLFASASVLSPNTNSVSFIPLITASQNSQIMHADIARKRVHPSYILSIFEKDNVEKTIAAKIINKDPQKRFEIIAVADSDFIYDSFWTLKRNILDKSYLMPIFDNANFILNSLESLTGTDYLIDIRGKSKRARPLQKIENLRKKNHQIFKLEESKIFKKIETAKNSIQEVWNKKDFEGRETFTPDEFAIISGIRKNLDDFRIELADLKKSQTKEINQIDFAVKFINIYSVPLVIVLIIGITHLLRRKKQTHKSKLEINKQISILAAISLLLLILGVLSIYKSQNNNQDSLIGKPAFKEIHNQINDIQQITFKSATQELNFYKVSNNWHIKDHPHASVYQERIRSFLSSLVEATYYEKKTSKAEYLTKFGLSPIEQKDSENTIITLKDINSKEIYSFEVGRHDINIGRGAKAAYIKFQNQFQVWLVAVDFISLDLNWQNWSYSSIWNLRFGRLITFNQNTDIDKTLNLARTLLNIYFESIKDSLNNPEHLLELSLVTESNDIVGINFYSQDDKFYISYSFSHDINNNKLKDFASNAKGLFFEISPQNFEAVKNVITTP